MLFRDGRYTDRLDVAGCGSMWVFLGRLGPMWVDVG